MNINRLDGHPHFIIRAVGVAILLPFWLAWRGIQKVRGKR